jgi:hypothetical protein
MPPEAHRVLPVHLSSIRLLDFIIKQPLICSGDNSVIASGPSATFCSVTAFANVGWVGDVLK